VFFLGHVISIERVLVDPRKMEVVLKWEGPANVTGIYSFLELVGYYKRFIKGFFIIAFPMTQLT
jgi:hypothetical protein